MTKVYLPQPQLDGTVGVRVSEGEKIVNRYQLVPGQYTDANTFAATDLSDQPANIRAVCEAQWTNDVVNTWKTAHPWVPPQPKSADQVRRETFVADAQRANLVERLKNATPAQINTYVDNQVTDLPSAKIMIKKILLVLSTMVGE